MKYHPNDLIDSTIETLKHQKELPSYIARLTKEVIREEKDIENKKSILAAMKKALKE